MSDVVEVPDRVEQRRLMGAREVVRREGERVDYRVLRHRIDVREGDCDEGGHAHSGGLQSRRWPPGIYDGSEASGPASPTRETGGGGSVARPLGVVQRAPRRACRTGQVESRWRPGAGRRLGEHRTTTRRGAPARRYRRTAEANGQATHPWGPPSGAASAAPCFPG